jgi:hypothetical protein
MRDIVRRLDTLLGAGDSQGADPVRALTLDLVIATVGFAGFGLALGAGHGAAWSLAVAGKTAAAFLVAFVLTLGPLAALGRFFEIATPWATLVGAFARHLAVGGVLALCAAGPLTLFRTSRPEIDGLVALGCLALVVFGALALRARAARRSPLGWLPRLPAALAVLLFLGLLAQSGWAFRPYLDPRGDSLFGARTEWFGGEARAAVERAVRHLGGARSRR